MTRIACVLKTAEGGLWVIPQLQELQRRGHHVIVVIPNSGGRLRRTLDELGFEVRELDFSFSFKPRAALVSALVGLRRLLRNLKIETVFYHLYASALAVRVATLGTGIRRVHMVAGPLYLDSWPIRAVEGFLCHLDHALIAGSDYTANRYRLIGRRRRLHTVPYGVDTRHFAPNVTGGDRRALSLDSKAFVVIMVAYVYAPRSSVYRGAGIKGHEILLESWRRFIADHSNSILVLLGGGFGDAGTTHREELMRHFADLDSVRWVDSVEDVRPYYDAADLSVSPSLSENHGAVLEASAMAVPSIVSDAGALPETVEDGLTGWVVPVGDSTVLADALAVAESAHQRGELSAMGRRARALMQERFEREVCSRMVADVVEGC